MWPSSSAHSQIAWSGGGRRGRPKLTLFSMLLEQALHHRRTVQKSGLVHHSDRSGHYLSIRYTERLAEAGIEPSVGTINVSYDKHSLRRQTDITKTELVYRQGRWHNMQDLEIATLA